MESKVLIALKWLEAMCGWLWRADNIEMVRSKVLALLICQQYEKQGFSLQHFLAITRGAVPMHKNTLTASPNVKNAKFHAGAGTAMVVTVVNIHSNVF